MNRGLTFGSVAERYEQFRPGYPETVADLLLERPVVSAVEVGAGTGKATRLVAGRGIAVTAVEPDPEMAAVLRRTTQGLPVTVLTTTFEDLPAQPPVDLLFSAAAWHWTDPATRWERAAELLHPGGTFAAFGGPIDVVDDELSARIERVRAEANGEAEVRSATREHPSGLAWPGHELVDSPWFTEVREDALGSSYEMPADDLVGLMSTVSAFLIQPPEVRDNLLARVRALLPDPVLVRRDLVVHRARRVETADGLLG